MQPIQQIVLCVYAWSLKFIAAVVVIVESGCLVMIVVGMWLLLLLCCCDFEGIFYCREKLWRICATLSTTMS